MNEANAYALFKDRKISVITFSTNDASFAIPLQQVLYIEKDVKRNIQLDELASFNHGVITYQNDTVELYDFNKLIGAEAHHSLMSSLIEELEVYEKAHEAWLEAIESAIQQNVPISTNSDKSNEFVKWTQTYTNSNSELEEVIRSLVSTTKDLHRDIEKLSHLNSQPEQAEITLRRITESTFKNLKNQIQQAKERAENSVRPIILFVEHDQGRVSALRLDNIQDIVNYDWSAFSSDESSEGLMKHKQDDYCIEGFLRNDDNAPLMLINCKSQVNAAQVQEPAVA